MKEIKPQIEGTPCSWAGKIYVKMSRLAKSICRLITNLVKITILFRKKWKNSTKIQMESQKTSNIQIYLKQKEPRRLGTSGSYP
jgi:hypothetical protein